MKLLLFLFVNLSLIIHAQDYIEYYNLCNEAEYYFDNYRYPEAELRYIEAFEFVDQPKLKDVELYIRCLLWDERSIEAFDFYYNYVVSTKGVYQLSDKQRQHSNIYFTRRQEELLDEISVDSLHEVYVISNQIDSIMKPLIIRDQNLRKAVGKLGRTYEDSIYWAYEGRDTALVSTSWAYEIESSTQDSILIDLIRSGLLLKTDLYSQLDFELLLIHMDKDLFKEVEMELWEIVRRGNLDPWIFARAVDRSYGNSGECPPYAVYVTRTFKYDCYSLDEIKQFRTQIGLSIYYVDATTRYFIPSMSPRKRNLDDFYSEMENFKQKKNLPR